MYGVYYHFSVDLQEDNTSKETKYINVFRVYFYYSFKNIEQLLVAQSIKKFLIFLAFTVKT